jgi:hypothetical protein
MSGVIHQADLSELLAAAREMIQWAEYETEYDGRMYTICQSCSGQDGDHHPSCKLDAFRALITQAEGSGESRANHSSPCNSKAAR